MFLLVRRTVRRITDAMLRREGYEPKLVQKTGADLAAYIVATVRIKDSVGFARYLSATAGLSERYGGTYLVRGKVDEILEGKSELGERVIVNRFDTADAARAYIQSPEYQDAVVLRAETAEVEMRLLVDPA